MSFEAYVLNEYLKTLSLFTLFLVHNFKFKLILYYLDNKFHVSIWSLNLNYNLDFF